jgi:alkylation response protein AidB-like acyl-CoA dehydrogenase
MAAGDLVATLALAEPGWRDEWGDPELTAHIDGDWVYLSGVKTFVPFAPHAHVLLVSARAGDEGTLLVGVAGGTPGLHHVRLTTLGGDPVYEVRLEAIRVPLANVVGPPHATAAIARALSCAVVGALAYAVGAAERVLEMTVEYARTRVQFGRPIGSFQAVAHRCADMRSDLDALRYLVYQAAWCLDVDRPSDLEVAAAKAYGNEALRRIFMHAHQVHGAIGFSTEHDLHLFTRRAKATELTWGATDLHLGRVAVAMGL